MSKFVKVVLGYTEDVWTDIFRQSGKEYRKPTAGDVRSPGRVCLRYGERGRRPFLLSC